MILFKVETDVNMHNQKDVIGMETDAVCEPEVSHILRFFGGVIDIYFFVWFCTLGTAEIGWFTVLLVWSFASITMLRDDMVSYYHSICSHIQSKTVWEHNGSCECYSAHIETEKLSLKISNELRA